MKITKIDITGMNKLISQSYQFNNATYITGDNGSGKSTILQAIQLGLLGYIPGIPKRNADIFEHCNNGMSMGVKLTFDTDDYIQRTWIKSGKSIQSSIDSSLSEDEINRLIAGIEVPIYNFNAFLALSNNAQKDWLLQFLTSKAVKIDWKHQLTVDLPEGIQPTEKLLSTIIPLCTDDVKATNTAIKQQLSMHKQMAANLSAGIQSLVYHDDIDTSISESEVVERIKDLQNKQQLYASYTTYLLNTKTLSNQLTLLQSELTEIDVDSTNAELQQYIQKYNEIKAKQTDLNAKLQMTRDQIKGLKTPTATKCPILAISCEALSNYTEKIDKQIKKLEAFESSINKELATVDAELGAVSTSCKSAETTLNRHQMITSKIESIETTLASYKKADVDYSDVSRPDFDIHFVDTELIRYNDLLVKLRANAKYSATIDSFTQQLAEVEQAIDVLKHWDKLTGPNGIQYDLISDNVSKFNAILTSYIAALWGPEYSCKFIISGASNSFKMGIQHNDAFLNYDVLSSGERCLYMLAFMLTVLQTSTSPLKMILVDDALDHLDDNHIAKVFSECSALPDFQIIFAGVKECNAKNIDIIKL